MSGTTFKRCACVDPATGAQLGRKCPKLRSPKHGRWYYQMRLGRARQFRQGGFATQAEAAAALDELRTRSNRQPLVEIEPDMTVGTWLDFWLAEKSKRSGASSAGRKVRSSTARSYAGHIEGYLRPHLGHLKLTALRAAHISAMFDRIAEAAETSPRPIGPATQRRSSLRCGRR